MRKIIRAVAGAFVVVVALLCDGAAAAGSYVVNVQLQDPSSGGGAKSMRIALDRDSVPAGKVTFRAVNQSKDVVHELVVVQLKPGQAELPYDEKHQEVVEKKVKRFGEIDNVKPGRSGTMTVNLKPGSYILICNEKGHYKAGMSVPLTVTK